MEKDWILTEDGTLCHHGILGQKWGVKNGPPYPLDSERASRKEKSKGFKESRWATGNDGQKNHSNRLTISKKNSSSNKKTYAKNSSEESNTNHGLNENQKKALMIGTSVVAAGLLAYGGYRVYKNASGVLIGSNSLIGKLEPTLAPRSYKKNLNAVNPGRIRFFSRAKNVEIVSGSSANCMLCTIAYDLRQRGYDVYAGLNGSGFETKWLRNVYGEKMYEQFHALKENRFDDVLETCLQYGDGARGNIMVMWGDVDSGPMGGHSMIWENVNGYTRFLDGQTGQEYKNFEKQILKNVLPKTVEYFGEDVKPIEILRTDNLDVDMDFLRRNKYISTLSKKDFYSMYANEIVDNLMRSDDVQLAASVVAVGAMGYTTSKLDQKQKRR